MSARFVGAAVACLAAAGLGLGWGCGDGGGTGDGDAQDASPPERMQGPRQPAAEPDAPDEPDEPAKADEPAWRVLVFSRTAGFRHESIPAGVECVRGIGAGAGFGVDATEDSAQFTDDNLARYKAVIFLNTTGDVLEREQEEAFERFIQAGGGYVGIHSAADTEYDWPWYGKLVGAYFRGHPRVQEATVRVAEEEDHPATEGLPAAWVRIDEWYDYRAAPAPEVRILLRLDESSYEGGQMGADHPIGWYHEFDGGRAIYTGGGHTEEAFREPLFTQHLAGAILWAAGEAGPNNHDPP